MLHPDLKLSPIRNNPMTMYNEHQIYDAEFLNALGMANLRVGTLGLVPVSSENLAAVVADALVSMSRFISDTGLRGVITSADSLSPESGVAVGFALASSEILSGGLLGLGTDNTSVSGTKGSRLASSESVTVGLFTGSSGKALLLRFICVTSRFGHRAGGPALSVVDKSAASSAGDRFGNCGLATDGSGNAATVNGLLLCPVCRVLDTGTGGTTLRSAVGKSDMSSTGECFHNCGLAMDGSADAAIVNGLLLSPVCRVLDTGTGGTVLPSTVDKFDAQFPEDSFCTRRLTTDGSGDAATINGLLLSPVCGVRDAGTGGTAFTAAVGKSDVLFTEDSFCTCGLATDGSC